jgi:hypothetical protein
MRAVLSATSMFAFKPWSLSLSLSLSFSLSFCNACSCICSMNAKEKNQNIHQIILDCERWCLQAGAASSIADSCLFSDVCDWIPSVTADTDNFFEKAEKVKNCSLHPGAFCFKHGKVCQFRVVGIDISGLPCVDMSRANHNRKFFEGKTNIIYLVWAKKHIMMGTKLLILENTPVGALVTLIACA